MGKKVKQVLWFTGLSGSGKSTIADNVSRILKDKCYNVKILDGDVVRNTLHRHLGFSKKDIMLNNKLISELASRYLKEYDIILVPIISPYRISREDARKLLGKYFTEVYIKTSLKECIKRDVKGLYKKALKNEIKNFIGISKNTPYEAPKHPEITIDTEKIGLKDSINKILNYIKEKEHQENRKDNAENKGNIDLHTHTTASDGILSPKQLLKLAVTRKLKAIAITDHDTVNGIRELVKQKAIEPRKNLESGPKRQMFITRDNKLEIVPGVEISCGIKRLGISDLHIIGLFIDIKSDNLNKLLNKAKTERLTQKRKMVRKLNRFGLKITLKEVLDDVSGNIGRPHLARIVLKNNPEKISSVKQVFDEYLGEGKKAYVKRGKILSLKDAVNAIKNAGGIPILAHPCIYKKNVLRKVLQEFADARGQGIEIRYEYRHIYNPNKLNNRENKELNARERLAYNFASRHKLFISGGSDFHGDKKKITLGLPRIKYNIIKMMNHKDD